MTAYSVLDRGLSGVDLISTWATARGWDSAIAVEFPSGAVAAASAVAGGLSRMSLRAWECLVDEEWDDRVSDAVIGALDGENVGVVAAWPTVVREASKVGDWVRDTDQYRLVRPEVIREVNALNQAVRGSFQGRAFQALLCDRRFADENEILTVHRWMIEWGVSVDQPELSELAQGVGRLGVSTDAQAAAVAKWMAATRFIAEQMNAVPSLPEGGIGEAVGAAVGVHLRPIGAVAAGAAAVVGADRVVGELIDAFMCACKVLSDTHGGDPVDVAVWVAEGLAAAG